MKRIRRNLAYFVVFLLLVGCSNDEPVPTGAAPADAPGDAAVAMLADVPATWTAVPSAGAIAAPPLGTLRPTAFPSPTSLLPPNTPRPTLTPTPTGTATATATPTPYRSSIPYDLPPSEELGPSKLGLHVIQNNDPAIMEFVRQAQPAVMKGVGDFGFLQEVKEVSPRTITIGRFPASHQDIAGNPEAAARSFIEEQLHIYESNPWVDYWEGWNEPDPGMGRMEWYARFEIERIRQMASRGYKVAIGGFPAGVPEIDEFALFVPAVEVAKEHQAIMTLHEGAAPTIDFLYGGALPGYPTYSDRGALSFRYRWFYRELLEPRDIVIPLVMSELGVDGMLGNRPGPLGMGWRDFEEYWREIGTWGPGGAESFINQLAWYDAGVRQDGYVIGFCIFTAGATPQWDTYDVNPILPQLTSYIRNSWP